MTKNKICGIKTSEDAIFSASLGVDFLGLIFVRGSHRYLSISIAKKLVSSFHSNTSNHDVEIVGVFANEKLDKITTLIEECSLDMVQLCSEESVDYIKNIQCPVIKQIRIPLTGINTKSLSRVLEKIKIYKDAGCHVLLDTLDMGSLGGTGRKFDWSVAQEISLHYPIWLAGGLDSSNVASAIVDVKPYAVDVSSGVETKKNKDLDKIKNFVDVVRNNVTI